MKRRIILLFVILGEFVKSCKGIGSKRIDFLKKSYPNKKIAEYHEGDIIIVLGFLEGHQPVVQDLDSYKKSPPYKTYAEEGYVMLCPDFQNFLKVKERKAYQVVNGALTPVSLALTGDSFIEN